MIVKLGKIFVERQEGENCVLQAVRSENGISEYDFLLTWNEDNAKNDDFFRFHWEDPVLNILYKWDSTCNPGRDVFAAWNDHFDSTISTFAPITCFFDGNGLSRYCWSLSECQKLVRIKNTINDKIGMVAPYFTVGVQQFTGAYSTTLTLRIDTRAEDMRKIVSDTALWWETTCGMVPTFVPEDAKDPVYSFWYSFHQDISAEKVEEECRRANDLGLDLCIIDDGWQTENNEGGYAYTGDWEPAPGKFPDMKKHVEAVHKIGMKYILWYSVPFVGFRSKHYEHFKDKLLYCRNDQNTGLLDPRYPEVREFLVNTYAKALKEWNLDGFKLDFIDNWRDNPDNAPYNPKMDIPALQDAVDVCMTQIVTELQRIKPDILLEFRQAYIGPNMKRFGNMFRVGDCPNDYMRNRVCLLDLRMLMGNQAVHSDMLMMAPSETPENNALQIISVMFGVLQYSAKLDAVTPDIIRMSKF